VRNTDIGWPFEEMWVTGDLLGHEADAAAMFSDVVFAE